MIPGVVASSHVASAARSYIGFDATQNVITLLPNTATVNDNWSAEGWHQSSGRTYVAASGDTVTGFSVYGNAFGSVGSAEVGLYTVVSNVPTTKVAAAFVSIGTAAGWNTTPMSVALTAGTRYTVCIDYDDSNDLKWSIRYGTIGASATSVGQDLSALPATWTQTSTSTTASGFYATVN
jgi:hypothetical protein